MSKRLKPDRPAASEHPSAVEFHELSRQVVGDTKVPGPDMQVSDQNPKNGLFYRESGRLLTSQNQGGLVVRMRAGVARGAFFEIQRHGKVMRQESCLGIAKRTNPVHLLADLEDPRYVAMRWLGEEAVHEVIPVYEAGKPVKVTIGSWLLDNVLSDQFADDPTVARNTLVRSREINNLALAFYESALHAYQDLPPARS